MAIASVVVQARVTSSRLPGKVLREIGGRTVISHVLDRCNRIPGNDVTCFAVPHGEAQQPLVDELARLGATVVRGSEDDVLDRYLAAARAVGADSVMRVTSDCPLIDPGVCGDVLRLVTSGAADYACNNMPRAWPHGLDCEAFTTAALAAAHAAATDGPDREHVTPWLRRATHLRRVNLVGPGGDMVDLRWTLDYPEDLTFFQALAELVPGGDLPTDAQALVELCRRHPEVAGLNAMRRDGGASISSSNR